MIEATRSRARYLTALALAILASGCGGDGGGGAATDATAVICLGAEPAGLNAFISPDQAAADLVPVLFTPLVRFDERGEIGPWLAESWSWDADHRRVTITIRDDVVWHDGTSLTAADVAWTLTAAADTAYAYWSGEDFLDLQEATAPDARTVSVEFARPTSGSMEAFVALPILPRHVLADVPVAQFAQAEYHRVPVGSGPFRFTGRRQTGDLVLERWDAFPAGLGTPPLGRIVLRTVPERSTQLVELGTGSVHACVLGASAADVVRAEARLEAIPVGPYSVQMLPLRNDQPPFTDARVRRAVSAALDRAEIAGVLSSVASPAANFLPLDNPYRDAALNQHDSDPALAAALLDSAGWRLGARDGIRVDARGRPLSFRLVAPQSFQEPLVVIQAQLRRVGIDARVELLEFASYVGLISDPGTRPPAMALIMAPTRVQYFDPFSEL
ncbi:MAG TPA: ABC transporter substrate-binding protein, partial [Longimicrobiales bacterium]|nr:ABC transporter substrate-binding protein [Longimicrobiales bacterium]